MGIFSDIYNTVAKFFRPVETDDDASKSVATNRLKLVLMQDRTNLTPKVLEQMRGEMIELLSKYLEMDKELLELNFEQEGDQVALMLSIPVIRAKDEEEIEAAGVNFNANDEEDDEEMPEEDIDNSDSVVEDSSEVDADSEAVEEAAVETEETEAVKPKRRRSKKVTSPEGVESNDLESNAEEQVLENAEN